MMLRLRIAAAALALSLSGLGCSSTDDTGAAPGPVDLGPYPEGPYGHEVGSTIPNLLWQGYVNETADGLATERPFVPYSMDDVRRSGKPYALVHVSEFY
jgi:hypothetical protein